MLHQETVGIGGNAVFIRVPGCCAPSVAMRLLSSQECARCRSIRSASESACAGNANIMHVSVVAPTDDDRSRTTTVLAPADVGSRLPFVSG